MATTGHVTWTGGLQDGSGSIDTGSGALDGLTYSAVKQETGAYTIHRIVLDKVGTVPDMATTLNATLAS